MAEKAARADALEAEVANLKAQNADADERIGRLMQILKAFDRARFGRRSEKSWAPPSLTTSSRLSSSRKSRPALLRSRPGSTRATSVPVASVRRGRAPRHL
ncbi:hypothetical protein [Martelella mediterranea]|uniref:hypothetical protein n=1 Tax=Martelella mediterranea TaxID=293089 RepID=UPI0003A1602E